MLTLLRLSRFRGSIKIRSQCRDFSTSLPSDKTTIMLKKLPLTQSESSLKKALSEVKFKALSIEPGCVIHFSNVAEAEHSKNVLKSELGCDSHVVNASMPSLLLQNLPPSVTTTVLQDRFSATKPQFMKIIGNPSLQIVIEGAGEALLFGAAISKLSPLKFHIVKVPGDKYAVTVSGVGDGEDAIENARSAIEQALKEVSPHSTAQPEYWGGADRIVRIRSSSGSLETEMFTEQIAKMKIKDRSVSLLGSAKPVKKPALMIRNIKGVSESSLQEIVHANVGVASDVHHISFQRRSADVHPESAVAYFTSEEAALSALSRLQGCTISGVKISVSYREFAIPAVKITNAPQALRSEAKLLELFKDFNPSRVSIFLQEGKQKWSARVELGSPQDVENSVKMFRRPLPSGDMISLVADYIHDIGVSILLPKGVTVSTEDISQALEESGVTYTSFIFDSNISAVIGFLTSEEAFSAQKKFVQGALSLNAPGIAADGHGSKVAASVSSHASYSLEVVGLDAETPAAEVLKILKSDKGPLVDPISIDRSAILKFKRHLEIVPAFKQLKQLRIDGIKIIAVRYRHDNYAGLPTAYDNEADDENADGACSDETFDRISLRLLLKDYMYADPATRYQIARNSFERTLTDALNTDIENINYLVDGSVSQQAVAETKVLIAKVKSGGATAKAEATERLFEIFLQRDDMAQFIADFSEFESLLGKPVATDPFDWSQFRIEVDADLDRLQKHSDFLEGSSKESRRLAKEARKAALKAAHKRAADRNSLLLAGETEEKIEELMAQDGGNDDESAEFKKIMVDDDGEEKTDEIIDPSGRLWTGTILDTDTVQKTEPSGRVLSHRALVVVGNLRGTAGFGMGKGKTLGEATQAACRYALRHLVHIDLYDNFGLAHDCLGKHNSCRAYIRATPRSRTFVGSNFAEAVLGSFGISSASVKLVGRRDPYAMVNALFNGVKHHVNLDEFAKSRGKRYLTLKWAMDHNL